MNRALPELLPTHSCFGIPCSLLAALLVLLGSAMPATAQAPLLADRPTVHTPDSFAALPFAESYEERHRAFLNLHALNPGNGPYSEAVRVYQGQAPDEALIRRALERMDARQDCADFGMHGILRLLHQFGESPLLSSGLMEDMRASVLRFKYWPDEPGVDSMCSWSENHFILFASGGYLAGQKFPDAIFSNSGQTGREKMAVCRPRVLRWLDLRYQTGFSEWLSHVYYDEDLAALINLVDFCDDPEIAQKAAMVTDLLIADMALNSFQGAFGSTHGRSYEDEKKHPDSENTGPAQKLLFGVNRFGVGNMSSTCLALSTRYRMPAVLQEIAADSGRPVMLNRQRVGIRVREAKRWGLDVNRLEDGMTFLTLEAYNHPKTINLMLRMMDEYGWWENKFFEGFAEQRPLIDSARRWRLMPMVARCYEKDLTRNLREEVNIYTFRTPDYMLSSAQDYRKGYGGDQQHIWHATLGGEAVCFTTHPAQYDLELIPYGSPGYWTGSGDLPRVAQVENTVIALYRISTRAGLFLTNALFFTHAWLPKAQFDAVVEKDGWIFARKGDGYLALWSQQPLRWQDEDRELIAEGKENIWICELGRRATDGSFEAFMEQRLDARLECNGLELRYDSPAQGRLDFGWRGPLSQNGKRVALKDYPRYSNPYVEAPFPGDAIEFRHGDHWLRLDWKTLERDSSAWCAPGERPLPASPTP
ncbi:MAG: hypothetical protein HYV27_00105 [Candidatus Hydrogenedentes bacterium]|nr:hypothetical protein [Candidatus Hydrogenedentota bacterium]